MANEGIELMLGVCPCSNLCPNLLLQFVFSFIVTLYAFNFLSLASTSGAKFSVPNSRMWIEGANPND